MSSVKLNVYLTYLLHLLNVFPQVPLNGFQILRWETVELVHSPDRLNSQLLDLIAKYERLSLTCHATTYLFLERVALHNRRLLVFVGQLRLLVGQSRLLLPGVAGGPRLAHALLPGLQLGPGGLQLLPQPADLGVLDAVGRGLTGRPEVEETGAEAEVGGAEPRHVTGALAQLGGDGPQKAEAVVSVEKRFSSAGNVDGMRGAEKASTGQALRDGVPGAVPGLVSIKTAAVPRLGGLTEPTGLPGLAARVIQISDTQILQGSTCNDQFDVRI